MECIKLSAFVLVLVVILAACSQGRQDPLGPGAEGGLTEGRLSRGADGPNLALTSVNSDSAIQVIDEEVFSAFLKARSAVPAGSQAAEAVRITGDYSGYALVDGSTTLRELTAEYELKLTFYDYSHAGSIYIGGSLRYMGSANVVSYQELKQRIVVYDEIKVAGSYTGFVRFFGYLLPSDNTGNLISVFAPMEVLEEIDREGTVTFRSEENTFTFNPYPLILGQ